MANKISVQDFIHELLVKANLKGIHRHTDSVICQCPFHFNKKNFKTFSVCTEEKKWKYTDENGKPGIAVGYFYNCFSCHEHGNVYKLIAHLSRCSYSKAIKLFKKRVILDEITISTLNKEFESLHVLEQREELDEIALPPVAENETPMLKYFENRARKYHGVLDSDYVIGRYGLYYCSTGRWAGRIIMPIFNSQNVPVCFNDRTINETIREKSLHVKDLPYGRVLYGWDYNSKKKHCIIVEGAFDKWQVELALRQSDAYQGVFDVLALQGTAFTDDQATMVIGKYDHAVLLLDYDEAGMSATKKIYDKLKDEIDVKIATDKYPEGKDPGKCTGKEIVRAVRFADKPKRTSYLEYIVGKNDFRI